MRRGGQALHQRLCGATEILAGAAAPTVRLLAGGGDHVEAAASRRMATRPREAVFAGGDGGVVVVAEGGNPEHVGEEGREPACRPAGVEICPPVGGERNLHVVPLVRRELLGPFGRTEHRAVHSGVADQVQLAELLARLDEPGQFGGEVGFVVQAGDDDLGVGMRGRQLAAHGGRGHRELGRSAPVVGGVGHPNHLLAFVFRCDSGERDAGVIALRDPRAVVADQLQRLGPLQVEHPHAGRRRAVEVKGQPVRFGGHVMDRLGGDLNRRVRRPGGRLGDDQLRAVPVESAFLEGALDRDYESARRRRGRAARSRVRGASGRA